MPDLLAKNDGLSADTSAGVLDRNPPPTRHHVSPPYVCQQQELEGLEALPAEEWNPFELAAADEAATVANSHAAGAVGAASSGIATARSSQRARKRPRPTSSSTGVLLPVERVCANPRSGQWPGKAGKGNGSAGDFSLPAKRPRTAARREPIRSLCMSQVCVS